MTTIIYRFENFCDSNDCLKMLYLNQQGYVFRTPILKNRITFVK